VKHRIAVVASTAGLAACATLGQIAALRHVNFALGGVQDGRIAGVPLTRIASYRDLSALDIGRLGLAVARKDVPLDMQLNIRADNPAENRTTATMAKLAWTLLLDNKETVSGVLDTSVTLPAGQPVTIPLKMRLNLIEFFGGSAEDLLNLAAGLAGLNADPTRITVRATPTINTPLGRISYPSPITIVSTTVSVPRR
jgi:hypothetical protein